MTFPLFRAALVGLALGAAPLRAQTADAPFHTAAGQFIGGDNAAALATVEAGLRAAPRDPRLLRLKAEIEKKQDEQQQNQQNQNDEQNKDGQNQNQSDDKGQPGDEQGQNQRQNGQPPQNPPEQQDRGDGQKKPDDSQKGQPRPESQGSDARPSDDAPRPDPTKMSRAEAQRILEALGNEEETLIRRVARPNTRARRVEKDW